MSNRYLEKIASGFIGKTVGGAWKLTKDTAKGVGNQFHNALGGAYRDYAEKNLGIKDPKKLMQYGSSNSEKLRLARELVRQGKLTKDLKTVSADPSFKHRQNITRLDADAEKVMADLQNKTNAGRIASLAMLGAGAYGGVKAYQHFIPSEPNYDQYYQ